MNVGEERRNSASSPRTTVVITTHNYGRFLAQCIDSVLAQSRRPARLLVLDDASDDNTSDVLLGYGAKITAHHVDFRNSQRTRNFGLALATTEYVLFVDADDYLENTAIEKLEEALDRAPAARVAYCDKHVFGDPSAMGRLRLEPRWRAPEFSLETLRFRNFIMLTSLVRRAYVAAFDERIRRLQDWDLWLGMLHEESHAVHVPEALLHYRVHGTNISIRQSELLERLKILVKHGLITLAPMAPGPAPVRAVAIVASGSEHADVAAWRDLALRRGWAARVITASRVAAGDAPTARDAIVRDGPLIVQTALDTDLETLLWRFSGAITDDRNDAVVVTDSVHGITCPLAASPRDAAVMQCEVPFERIMVATSLEAVGTFALSPAAARLLLYLRPADRPTAVGRLRRAAAELFEQHLAWRFRRTDGTDIRQCR